MSVPSKLLEYRNPRHEDAVPRVSLLSLVALVLPFLHPTLIFLPISGWIPANSLFFYFFFGPLVNMAIALLAVWRVRRSRGTLKGGEIAWIAFFIDLAMGMMFGAMFIQMVSGSRF